MRRSDPGTRAKVAYNSFAFNQKSKKTRPDKISNNLTEELVQAEMDLQMAALPNKAALFVKRADIMAYALNRLPAFYASTNRGRQRQEDCVPKELYPKIQTVVRYALAAVMADPLRTGSDAWQPPEQPKPEQVLAKIKILLKLDCNWDSLVDVIEYRLAQANRGEFYLDSANFADWEKHPLYQE